MTDFILEKILLPFVVLLMVFAMYLAGKVVYQEIQGTGPKTICVTVKGGTK